MCGLRRGCDRPGLVRSHVGVTARSHHHATIIFINIFGLDDLSSITNPAQLMEFIDSIFMMYDRLAEYHGIMKMRTLCDGCVRQFMRPTGNGEGLMPPGLRFRRNGAWGPGPMAAGYMWF